MSTISTHETERIADQLHRAVNGSAWHGPALLLILDDVSAERAAARSIAGVHTIWEIVAHVTAWLDLGRQRIEGAAIGWVPDEVDWPTVTDTSRDAWSDTLAALRSSAERLETIVASLPDERLTDELPGAEDTWSAYHTAHGVVQHVLYHAGQIAILKKANAEGATH